MKICGYENLQGRWTFIASLLVDFLYFDVETLNLDCASGRDKT
jgi:hypothetical protein